MSIDFRLPSGLRAYFRTHLAVAALLTAGCLVSAPFAQSAYAAENEPSGHVSLDRVTAARALANGIEIHSGSAVMQVTALREDLLRVRVGAPGTLPGRCLLGGAAGARTAKTEVKAENQRESRRVFDRQTPLSHPAQPLAMTVTDLAGNVIAEDIPEHPIEFHGAEFRVYKQLAGR